MDKGSGSSLIYLMIWALAFIACGDKKPIPKPYCYLRTNLPAHNYMPFEVKNNLLSYQFDASNLYSLKQNIAAKDYGFQEFDLGPLNGSMLVYSKLFNSKDSLIKLINPIKSFYPFIKTYCSGISITCPTCKSFNP